MIDLSELLEASTCDYKVQLLACKQQISSSRGELSLFEGSENRISWSCVEEISSMEE